MHILGTDFASFGRKLERGLPLRELKSLLLRAFTVQGGQLEDFKGDNVWE